MKRLRAVADGVWVATSEMEAMSSVVVAGASGALVIDPGVFPEELDALVEDLRGLGRAVAVGFATHFHWDHVLWARGLGRCPRLATAATVAMIREHRVDLEAAARARSGPGALHGFGDVTACEMETVPWDGPDVVVVTHDGHAKGHAALWIPALKVLIAGDLLSDVEVPTPAWEQPDAIGDFRRALDLLRALPVDVFVPGHGHAGDGTAFATRLAWDTAYLDALEHRRQPDDARLALAGARAMHEENVAAMASRGA